MKKYIVIIVTLLLQVSIASAHQSRHANSKQKPTA